MSENLPMPNGDNAQNNKRDIISMVFGIVSVVAVLVCIVVMITCCITFFVTTLKFSDELSDTLKVITNSAVSTNSSEKSLSSSSAATASSSSVATASSSSDAASESLPEKKEKIENLITHMESMVAIQRSGMTNDLMSFIYGILSTILVGLCAGFVVKSQASADEAKRIASEAKTNIEKAESQAKEVAKEADDTKEAINEARKATKEAQDATSKAKENAQKAEENAKEVTEIVTGLLYQVRLTTVSSKIMYANSLILELISLIKELEDKKEQALIKELEDKKEQALIKELKDKKEQAFNKRTQATGAIKQIRKEITGLFSDEKFLERIHAIDTMELEKVYNQLIDLKQIIDSFLYMLSNQQKNPDIESMEAAARNYKYWVEDAIESMVKKRNKKELENDDVN